MNKRLFGAYGEDIAGKYLIKNGYEILQKNFRTKFGEIDIIAKDGKKIVFVEVKTREDDKFVSPFTAVNKNKQKHIIKAGLFYLKNNKPFEKVECRFDVVSIITNTNMHNVSKVELIKDAFQV